MFNYRFRFNLYFDICIYLYIKKGHRSNDVHSNNCNFCEFATKIAFALDIQHTRVSGVSFKNIAPMYTIVKNHI